MKKLIAILIIIGLAAGGWFCWTQLSGGVSEQGKAGQAAVYDAVPEYSGDPSVDVNGGRPAFAEGEVKTDFFEDFTDLDGLGRCGPATACLDEAHMPEGERGSIGMIRPSGWQLSKYEFIDNGGYLFNRCHMIGWQLSGENAEERNLITGTRYMNVEGMLPYENRVASYLRETGNHVMYRVTPVFSGRELVARGVQIEAQSVEDEGRGLAFNVYCYNVQPGVEIDYRTGENRPALAQRTMPAEEVDAGTEAATELTGKDNTEEATRGSDTAGGSEAAGTEAGTETGTAAAGDETAEPGEEHDYVLNTNTRRFHYPDCGSVQDMKDKNKREAHGTREQMIEEGYQPCGRCRP